ncbi:MAG: hypothetical protein ACP5FZ_00570 [Fidelibacterota bacterium]
MNDERVSIDSGKVITTLFWVGVFSIAMGFLEAIVVVYLRKIYYPGGFVFPMSPVSPQMYLVELVREIATLIMLVSIGFLAGKKGIQRLAYFLISFGVWDIFYYVALKLFLDWPDSLLTWDVLFLIPLPWLGPVIAPVLVSLSMIWIGINLILLDELDGPLVLKADEWLLLMAGCGLIFISFIWNYAALIIRNGFLPQFFLLAENRDFLQIVYDYVPEDFNWFLFFAGELLAVLGMLKILFQYRRLIQETARELYAQLRMAQRRVFHSN